MPIHDLEAQLRRETYTHLCNRVGQHCGLDGLASELRSLLFSLGASFTAVLRLLCKTTKPDGEVSFRKVHCSSNNDFAGLA